MKRTTDSDRGDRSPRTQRDPDRDGDSSRTKRGSVAALQQSVGNQAVKELHERGEVQAKLEVSRPDDPAEREAERVAADVLDKPEGPEVEASVLRQTTDTGGTAVDAGTEAEIESVTSGGSPLSQSAREFFEPRFGRDFSDVQVHTGPEADEAARSIDAEAFTLGSDIAFRSGAYRPGSRQGKELLAHELTHVVQQRAGPARKVRRQDAGTDSSSGQGQTSVESGRVERVPPADLSEQERAILEAAGWDPMSGSVHMIPANRARGVAGLQQQIATDQEIQTFLQIRFMQENAELVESHTGRMKLSLPNDPAEFNTFWQEVAQSLVGKTKSAFEGELLDNLLNQAGNVKTLADAYDKHWLRKVRDAADQAPRNRSEQEQELVNDWREGLRTKLFDEIASRTDKSPEEVKREFSNGKSRFQKLEQRRQRKFDELLRWYGNGGGGRSTQKKWERPD